MRPQRRRVIKGINHHIIDYDVKYASHKRVAVGISEPLTYVSAVDIDITSTYTDSCPEPKAHFFGKYFIVEIDRYQYFHTLHDKVGQYLAVKRFDPEVKLALISSSFWNRANDGYRYMKEIFELMEINPADIIVLERYEGLFFEEVVYFYNKFSGLSASLPFVTSPFSNGAPGFNDVNDVIIEELRKLFLPHMLPKDDRHPDKIFISRSSRQDYMKQMISLMEEANWDNETYLDLAVVPLKKPKNGRDDIDGDIQLLKERYFPEQESALMKELEKLGYAIIDVSGMSMIEQMSLHFNATHVVAINGTGAYNIIFCKEDVKATIINLSNYYGFCYEKLISLALKQEWTPSYPKATPWNYIFPSDIEYLVRDYLKDRL